MLQNVYEPKGLQKVNSKRVNNSSLYWYVSDTIEGPYKPGNNDFIVRGSEQTRMYGTNFLQISADPEAWIAYGWYHRLHALAVSSAFRVIWSNTADSPSIIW